MEAYTQFDKKIVPYLDGSLSQDEKAEFEAFVLTHPEFEGKIRSKKEEIELLMSLIPKASLSSEAMEGMENEIKASIFNLLKPEPKTFLEGLGLKWEEWINR